MDFRTIVEVEKPIREIGPCEQMLFVGSCFADRMGKRFVEERFLATVNPYGVMYNPASILHSVERFLEEHQDRMPKVVFLTLGTNHVYVLRETGEIVDNCQKRPARLFEERVLGIDECVGFLRQAVALLQKRVPAVMVVLTVSPIRYAKYGYHGSALSKASLLLAADTLVREMPDCVCYFPAYEIVNDELRDYRFYQPDMLHPSDQAVEYIWERLSEAYLSAKAKEFLVEWRPIKEAMAHRPFHPDSEAYKTFRQHTIEMAETLAQKYPSILPLPW